LKYRQHLKAGGYIRTIMTSMVTTFHWAIGP